MRPAAEATDERPRPTASVDVTEVSSAEGDAEEWTVTLRWAVPRETADGNGARSGDGNEADDSRAGDETKANEGARLAGD
jgi:hypothetical protein